MQATGFFHDPLPTSLKPRATWLWRSGRPLGVMIVMATRVKNYGYFWTSTPAKSGRWMPWSCLILLICRFVSTLAKSHQRFASWRRLTQVYMEYGEEDQLFEATRVALPNRDRLRGDGWLDLYLPTMRLYIVGMYGKNWYIVSTMIWEWNRCELELVWISHPNYLLSIFVGYLMRTWLEDDSTVKCWQSWGASWSLWWSQVQASGRNGPRRQFPKIFSAKKRHDDSKMWRAHNLFWPKFDPKWS